MLGKPVPDVWQEKGASGSSKLHEAVTRSELSSVPLDAWVRGKRVPNAKGWTPLHQVAMMGKFDQVPKGGLTPEDLLVKDMNGRTVIETAVAHKNIAEIRPLLTPSILRTQILGGTESEAPVFVHLAKIKQLAGLPSLVPGDLSVKCRRGNALCALAYYDAIDQVPKELLFSAEGVLALKERFGPQRTSAAHLLANRGKLDQLPVELPGDFMLVADELGNTPYHRAFISGPDKLNLVPLHLRRLTYLAAENASGSSVLDMVLDKQERDGFHYMDAVLPQPSETGLVIRFWEVQSEDERVGWGKLAEHINEIDRWLKATDLVRSDVGISPASGGEFDPFAL